LEFWELQKLWVIILCAVEVGFQECVHQINSK